jgi:hypothetical protein
MLKLMAILERLAKLDGPRFLACLPYATKLGCGRPYGRDIYRIFQVGFRQVFSPWTY